MQSLDSLESAKASQFRADEVNKKTCWEHEIISVQMAKLADFIKHGASRGNYRVVICIEIPNGVDKVSIGKYIAHLLRSKGYTVTITMIAGTNAVEIAVDWSEPNDIQLIGV